MTDAPDAVEELPPAATLVYWWLADADDPMTRRELSRETTLAPSTVKHALGTLDDHDLLERDHCHDPDGRTPAYTV